MRFGVFVYGIYVGFIWIVWDLYGLMCVINRQQLDNVD